MKKFIKITTRRSEDGAILRSWINIEEIDYLSQNSITQEGNNEGTCVLSDGKKIEIVDFNATIDSLN
jgi:hypothetical protein